MASLKSQARCSRREVTRYYLFPTALVLAACGPILADTHYVSANSTNPVAPYTNRATASTMVQDAVDAAIDGDTVLVGTGAYVMPEVLSLTNAVILRSERGAGTTLLQGMGEITTNRCVIVSNAYATLQGFTVRGGRSSEEGGGILVERGLVRDCVITSNVATTGGGLFVRNGEAVGCLVSGNTAITGGGVGLSQSAVLRRCTIEGNHASIGGGLFMKDGSEQMVENCIIRWNTAEDRGGGLNVWNNGTVNNCLIVQNVASNSGGGVNEDWDWSGVRSSFLNNCTIADNWAPVNGGLNYTIEGGVIRNCIVYGNANGSADCGSPRYGFSGYDAAYCCLQAASDGAGNITNDPGFFNPVDCDYRLVPTSACIEAGTSMEWMFGSTDMDGNSRVINRWVDIGAYEYPNLCQCDFTAPIRSGAESVVVTFEGGTLVGTNAPSTFYSWDFDGNGTWDAEGWELTHVTNTYTNYACYNVALMASNLAGQVVVATKSNYVKVGPAVLHVSPVGLSVSPYSDWQTAATNLQDAVDLAADGSVVLLTNDTYTLSKRVRIAVGLELRGIDPHEHPILDGNGVSGGLYIDHTNAVVHGLTITNCLAAGTGQNGAGAAVFLDNGGMVRDCTLSGNWAENNGGGVCLSKGGTVSNCVITGNSALSGAGVYFGSAGVMVDCVISNNTSRDQGGGAFLADGGDLHQSKIIHNSAPRRGGGVYTSHLGDVHDCEIVANTSGFGGGIFSYYNGSSQRCGIWNCRMVNNSASGYGGGVSLSHGGYWSGSIRNCLIVSNSAANGAGVDVTTYGEILNCTIADNVASVKGGGIYGHFFGGSENAWVYDSIIWSNKASASANYYACSYDHCCTVPAAPGGGNKTNDPQFVNAPAGDYHLADSSPCMDSAGNRSWMSGSSDLDGHPRVAGGVADRGCYEAVVGQGSVCGILLPDEAVVQGAQWQLRNGPDTAWHDSGGVVSGLPPGTYTAGFRSIGGGWVTPSSQVLELSSAQSLLFTGQYVKCGSVLCALTPEDVVQRGARWRLTSGPNTEWHESAVIVSNLPPGSYGITFTPMDGWTTPPDRSFNLRNAQSTNICAAYESWGGVSFVIEPRAARDNGAHWRLTTGYDTSWQESGALVLPLKAGTYTVSFERVGNGWTEPWDQQVDITDGTTNSLTASYFPYPSISCIIEPARARLAGAQWRLTSNGNTEWMESSSTVTNLAPGNYTLTFRDIGGWLEPADQTVTLERDRDTNLTVNYVEPILSCDRFAWEGKSYAVVLWDGQPGWLFNLYSTTNLISEQWTTNRYQLPGQSSQMGYLEWDVTIRSQFFRLEAERQ